jgi:hypothetical protein
MIKFSCNFYVDIGQKGNKDSFVFNDFVLVGGEYWLDNLLWSDEIYACIKDEDKIYELEQGIYYIYVQGEVDFYTSPYDGEQEMDLSINYTNSSKCE